MNQSMKDNIDRLGFGGLLKFNIDAVEDRTLAMFLMSHVKDNPPCIQVKDRILSLSLPREAIDIVLGLPMGSEKLPTNFEYRQKHDALVELRKICVEKGMEGFFRTVGKKTFEGRTVVRGQKDSVTWGPQKSLGG